MSTLVRAHNTLIHGLIRISTITKPLSDQQFRLCKFEGAPIHFELGGLWVSPLGLKPPLSGSYLWSFTEVPTGYSLKQLYDGKPIPHYPIIVSWELGKQIMRINSTSNQ